MSQIEFRITPSQHRSDKGEIAILIDSVDLRELARQIELTQPGALDIAGQYAGLPADRDILPPSEHFLGRPRWQIYDYDGKTQVLGCDCGEPGCWPLVCTIDVRDSEIIWREFEQPHRSSGKNAGVVWNYDALGPFRFQRAAYEKALASLPRADAA